MKNRTYRYLETSDNVLYPFGYGLTYSDFSLKILSADKDKICAEITNNGDIDASEVIQLYIHADDENAPLNPWLCGFKKVLLDKGETKIVDIAINPDAYDIYSGKTTYRKDKYRIYVGFGQPSDDSDIVEIVL